MSVSNSVWPGGCGVAILLTDSDTYNLEPSGLTVFNDGTTTWFYLASDNGKLARRKTDLSDDWASQDYGSSKANDFESITSAKGELMIGIEGGSSATTYAQIKRFDPTDTTDGPLGSFTSSVWTLTDPTPTSNAGMEAMTFVPTGSYPTSWTSSTPYYGGLFFAAFQSQPGKIYVYNLPQGGAGSHNVSSLTSFTTQQSTKKISDMYFANNTLYVLYDDTTDSLEEMQLNSGKTAYVTTYLTTPPYVGCEAMALIGNDLYIGLDQSGTPPSKGTPSGQFATNGLANDYVLKYKNYCAHVQQTC